ncbi:MAG TPA: MBL fold metallo-hydrolase [Holophaga sp.]|nr:MBL fold metallo-hydrolase [Holophaga sp.]
MIYASLASGSKGNCHAFSHPGGTLLVDAGISLKQIRLRMAALGLEAGEEVAVALTHEHSDHIGAVPVLLRRTPWVFMGTPDTLAAVERILGVEIPAGRRIQLVPGRARAWNGFEILPFTTPHDAVDSVAYRVSGAGLRAAVVTDLGQPTALVEDHCRDLDLLVLEANHDVPMLREGPYPPPLKARILSRVGHLSNEAMADLLARVLSPALRTVVLAHLSEQNNLPELARAAAEAVLAGREVDLRVASQSEPLRLANPTF